VKKRDKIEAITNVLSGMAIIKKITAQDGDREDSMVAKILAKKRYAPALEILARKPIFIA
jgi:hypothetical protein